VTQGTICHPDSDDPNNTYLEATPESVGNVYSRAICPGEEKWYVVSVNSGTTLKVELDTTALDGPLNIFVYDDNGTTVLGSSVGQVVDTQTVSASGFSGSRAYIEVVAQTSGTQNTYDLDITETGP